MALRVNVGCGMTPTPGWTNFDNSFSLRVSRFPGLEAVLRSLRLAGEPERAYIGFCREHDIAWADATRRLPFDDAAVDAVYSSHMLEHLDRDGADRFLREVRRVLRPQGALRLAVPDLELLARAYCRNGDADGFLRGSYLCVPQPRGVLQRLRAAAVGPRHHQWMYDARSLSALLQRHDFGCIVVQPPGRTMIVDPGALDLREREDESLYVEALRL